MGILKLNRKTAEKLAETPTETNIETPTEVKSETPKLSITKQKLGPSNEQLLEYFESTKTVILDAITNINERLVSIEENKEPKSLRTLSLESKISNLQELFIMLTKDVRNLSDGTAYKFAQMGKMVMLKKEYRHKNTQAIEEEEEDDDTSET